MIKNTSPILAAMRAAANSEAASVAFMEQQRWGDAPGCPLCVSADVYQMQAAGGGREQNYRWRCRDCKKMYTVSHWHGEEETRLPIRVWVFAFWQACASKKGISGLQLAREMEITHKSALFVLRRIRHGVGTDFTAAPKLKGTVEADETDRLGEVLAENADGLCRLITDDHRGYNPIGRTFRGGHFSVAHSSGEYVKKGTDIHSNTVEGVFRLLKRGIMDTFHSVSKKHLPNYLNEFEFRYNTRKVDDGKRLYHAIRKSEGKRLKYGESIDNPPYGAQPKGQAPAPFRWG